MKLFQGGVFRRKKTGTLNDDMIDEEEGDAPAFIEISSVRSGAGRNVTDLSGAEEEDGDEDGDGRGYVAPSMSEPVMSEPVISGFDHEGDDDDSFDSEI